MRLHFSFGIPLLILAFSVSAAEIRLVAPKEIKTLLERHLPVGDFSDKLIYAQACRRIEKEWPGILATEGYFEPKINFSEPPSEFSVTVYPGPRTHVTHVDLEVARMMDGQQKQALLATWALPVGKAFRQADWSAAKESMLAQLLAVDHAAARLQESRAEIDPQTQGARLKILYDAGPRYQFGTIQYKGLRRYSPDLVARFNRAVIPGEPYREDRLFRLQTQLQSSPYFASAQVEIDLDAEANEDGIVIAPVLVQLRERQPHLVSFGVGFSSNTGARSELNYQTTDLFRRAWELNSGIRLEQKKQSVYADIFLPPDASQYRNSFGTLAEKSDIQGLKTERFLLGVQRVQTRGEVEMRLSLNWQGERRIPTDAPASLSRSLFANGLWTWRHVDDLLDPRRGVVIQAQIGGAAKSVLSDQSFLRLHGRAQIYHSFNRRNQMSFRAEAGYTAAESRYGIPEEYLFRAGGTGSVRGYSYQSLGVKEGVSVVGGRYLTTASAEFTHWLDDRWGVAAFVDAGDASDDLKSIKPAFGYGLGARWKSPAGPVAVDLAYGERTRKMQLHFSLLIPF